MKSSELITKIQSIVSLATELKNKYTVELEAPVNYACIFSQGALEFEELKKLALALGKVVEETKSGPLHLLSKPIPTVSGDLRILKIRHPDATRPELGDADFTVSNYLKFKQNYITNTHFKLIPRVGWEMIELMEKGAKVRAYFSSEPVGKKYDL